MEQHILAHPFYPDRTIPLLLGNHVSAEDGTGAVHTAPGHGQEDHQVFQQYGLLNRYSAAELNPVDARGVYLSTTPPLGELTLAGLHIWKANPLIVDALRLRGVLLAAAEMHHSYPHCWRHKTPIVFRATPSGSSLWNKRPCAQPPSRPSHTSPGIPSGAKPASSA